MLGCLAALAGGVSENYPNLKGNQGFLNLQAQMEGTETAQVILSASAQRHNI